MPTITIPVTTYSVRNTKPTTKYGSPSTMPVKSGDYMAFARFSLDRVPGNATIDSAVLRVYTSASHSGTFQLQARSLSAAVTSSVTWRTMPDRVAYVGNSPSVSSPGSGVVFDMPVTGWAQSRPATGLGISTDSANTVWIYGSTAAHHQPSLIVTYHVPPTNPGNLRPNGGAVSLAQPVLTYAGDTDMTEQKVEFSTDGGATVNLALTADWHAATSGRYDPADHPGSPALADGGSIMWRVTTRGPDGTSAPSPWATYSFRPLATVAITAPGATVTDGSPTIEWTASDQTSFLVNLHGEGRLLASSGWRNEPDTRFWTPSGAGVRVPGGVGDFYLYVRDSVLPRVAAEAAPVEASAHVTYTTYGDGTAGPVDTLVATYEEPVLVLTGGRAAGVPDEVSLFRDGVQVPIWDSEGNVYGWAPGVTFFEGTNFTIRDYTAPLRGEHTWEVRLRVNGVVSTPGPAVTDLYNATSVWLVNPRTDERVEVVGMDDVLSVEIQTDEQSIVHVPLNGGLLVEPKRRRLVRTTKSGSLAGIVLNDAEAILDGWVEGDSGTKYRLVFGKENWSVIIGDYSPMSPVYQARLTPNRTAISLNWWQRLADV